MIPTNTNTDRVPTLLPPPVSPHSSEFSLSREGVAFFTNKVESVIPKWTRDLTRRGFSDFRICTNGALATGHFRGPKPREHSLNSHVPAKFSRVIEGDMRIIFPASVDPRDPDVIRVVAEVTGTEHKESKVIRRWNTDTPISYLYGYEDITDDLGFEWEVCLNRRPYLEIADKWKQVFLPEEIEYQANVRAFLRELRVDYATEFSTLKDIQIAECRYRIIAAVAMARYCQTAPDADKILASGTPLFDQEVMEFAQPLASLWLNGHSGLVGLDRPSPIASDESVAKLEQGAPHLLRPPTPPKWLTFAAAIQRNIRECKNRQA